MAVTYTPINSQTLTSNTATVVFSSIPQTYTDLVLIVTGYTNHTDDGARGYIQFNTDTGSNSNYSHAWVGSHAATGAKLTNKENNQPYIAYGVVGNTATYPSVNEINIHNYRNTSSWGLTLSKTGKYATAVNYGNRWTGGSWRNTVAIDTITLKADSSYNTGTTFSLYGIASA